MLWHLLFLLLSPASVLLAALLRDDRDRQVLALCQQVLILQRPVGKRPRLSRTEKLILLYACARMKHRQLPDCLMIVKPATLIGWHRQIVRWCWTFRPKHRPGRPRTGPQAEQLVLRLARENAADELRSSWGLRQDRRGEAQVGIRPSAAAPEQHRPQAVEDLGADVDRKIGSPS
jgi:hypothetical protein